VANHGEPIMRKAIDYIGVSVGAMIFNDHGELFLSKRGQACRSEKGQWETPGGSVELGEALEQAVKREIMEEYGVEIEIIEQFPAVNHFIPTENQHWVANTFLAHISPGQQPKIMEPAKCDAIGWFALDALPTPLTSVTKSDLVTYAKRDHSI
jgi:8-oxo-dGTP diphosphatase